MCRPRREWLSADSEERYRGLLTAFAHIEEADNLFILDVSKAVCEGRVQEIEIASLLLVNRLFTQSCRMQIYGTKDLLLSQEQIGKFDRAMDAEGVINAEKVKSRTNPD